MRHQFCSVLSYECRAVLMKGVQEDSLIAIDLHRSKYIEVVLLRCSCNISIYLKCGQHHDGRSLKLACNGFGLQ